MSIPGATSRASQDGTVAEPVASRPGSGANDSGLEPRPSNEDHQALLLDSDKEHQPEGPRHPAGLKNPPKPSANADEATNGLPGNLDHDPTGMTHLLCRSGRLLNLQIQELAYDPTRRTSEQGTASSKPGASQTPMIVPFLRLCLGVIFAGAGTFIGMELTYNAASGPFIFLEQSYYLISLLFCAFLSYGLVSPIYRGGPSAGDSSRSRRCTRFFGSSSQARLLGLVATVMFFIFCYEFSILYIRFGPLWCVAYTNENGVLREPMYSPNISLMFNMSVEEFSAKVPPMEQTCYGRTHEMGPTRFLGMSVRILAAFHPLYRTAAQIGAVALVLVYSVWHGWRLSTHVIIPAVRARIGLINLLELEMHARRTSDPGHYETTGMEAAPVAQRPPMTNSATDAPPSQEKLAKLLRIRRSATRYSLGLGILTVAYRGSLLAWVYLILENRQVEAEMFLVFTFAINSLIGIIVSTIILTLSKEVLLASIAVTLALPFSLVMDGATGFEAFFFIWPFQLNTVARYLCPLGLGTTLTSTLVLLVYAAIVNLFLSYLQRLSSNLFLLYSTPRWINASFKLYLSLVETTLDLVMVRQLRATCAVVSASADPVQPVPGAAIVISTNVVIFYGLRIFHSLLKQLCFEVYLVRGMKKLNKKIARGLLRIFRRAPRKVGAVAVAVVDAKASKDFSAPHVAKSRPYSADSKSMMQGSARNTPAGSHAHPASSASSLLSVQSVRVTNAVQEPRRMTESSSAEFPGRVHGDESGDDEVTEARSEASLVSGSDPNTQAQQQRHPGKYTRGKRNPNATNVSSRTNSIVGDKRTPSGHAAARGPTAQVCRGCVTESSVGAQSCPMHRRQLDILTCEMEASRQLSSSVYTAVGFFFSIIYQFYRRPCPTPPETYPAAEATWQDHKYTGVMCAAEASHSLPNGFLRELVPGIIALGAIVVHFPLFLLARKFNRWRLSKRTTPQNRSSMATGQDKSDGDAASGGSTLMGTAASLLRSLRLAGGRKKPNLDVVPESPPEKETAGMRVRAALDRLDPGFGSSGMINGSILMIADPSSTGGGGGKTGERAGRRKQAAQDNLLLKMLDKMGMFVPRHLYPHDATLNAFILRGSWSDLAIHSGVVFIFFLIISTF
jgi:hypothetical protein